MKEYVGRFTYSKDDIVWESVTAFDFKDAKSKLHRKSDWNDDRYILDIFISDSEEDEIEFFSVTRIHRGDLEQLGFDIKNISDKMMRRLASKMANDYMNQLYWSSMEILAEELGIEKVKD